MFTEASLRDHPALVKVFTGLSADQFWELVQQMAGPARRRPGAPAAWRPMGRSGKARAG